MNYHEIKKKYQDAGCTNYKLRNTEDLVNIIGLDVTNAKYFNELTSENKEIITKAIIQYLNGCGLQYREGYKLTKAYLCQEHKLIYTNKEENYRTRIAYMALNVTNVDNIRVEHMYTDSDYEEYKDKAEWEIDKCYGQNTFLRIDLVDENNRPEWFHVIVRNGEIEFY